jgi:hypothetical protein
MLIRSPEAALSPSPDTRDLSAHPPQQRRLPPTPSQRRMGTQIAIGLIVLALLIIFLLDHYGVIH